MLKRSARILYRAAPLSPERKLEIKNWLFRRFGPLFERTAAYRAWVEYEQIQGRDPGTADKGVRVSTLLRARFPSLQPLRVFLVPGAPRRLTVVTDSINRGSLFGGVGTALALAVTMARRQGATLRVVTRTEKAEQANFREVLDVYGMEWSANMEFAFADQTDPHHQLDVGPEETFLTTSWWTTWSVRAAVGPKRIVYLLQEDERMFYAMGEEHLRCSEILEDPDLRFIVNSRLLFDHLQAGGASNVIRNGVFFEPAFPSRTYYPDGKREHGKRNFFFYARPNHDRNLFYRGLESINTALEAGSIAPDEWNLFFVGGSVPNLLLARGVRPTLIERLPWQEYAALVRQIDVGLALMYTPHPSYPPLDLAASGAVVVTNRFGNKTTLEEYSSNIITTGLSHQELAEGLGRAVQLAKNPTLRAQNFERSRLNRDWPGSFDSMLAAIEK